MSDITANVVVSMPSQLFTMPRSFKAVANGKIYIGQIDTDPVNPSNQIQVYLENEDGSHVPVSQPLIINAGGYPVYNGQIAKFVTVQGHSMAIYDASGVQQFYFPNVLKYDPDQFEVRLAGNDGINLVGGSDVYVYVANGVDDSSGIASASAIAVSKNASLKIKGIAKVVSPTNIDAQISYTEKQIFTIDSKITLNGRYALPDWFGDVKGAVDAAINAMPSGGGIIHCLNKTYKENGYMFGSTPKFIGKDNIWIRGSGNPRTSSDYKSLESGTVLQGTYLIWANNVTITDCGFDSGYSFVGSEYAGTPVIGVTEGLLCTYPDAATQASGTVKTGLRVNNITTLAYNSTFPVHSFIVSEGYSGSVITNVRSVMGYHGVVVKGKDNFISDVLVECAGGNATILKSEWASSPVRNVMFNNITCYGAGIEGSTPHDTAPPGAIACNLDLHGQPMDSVSIPYIKSTGYTLGVRASGQGAAVNMVIGEIQFTPRDIGQGSPFQVVDTDSKTTFSIGHISAANCSTVISTGDVAANINLNSFEAVNVETIADIQGGTNVNINTGVYENVTDGLWRINGNSRVRCGTITVRGTIANEFASGGQKFTLVNGWTEIPSSPFAVALRGGCVVLNGLIRSGTSSTAVTYPAGFAPAAAIRKATITKSLTGGQAFGTLSVMPETYSVVANEAGGIDASSDYISAAIEWDY